MYVCLFYQSSNMSWAGLQQKQYIQLFILLSFYADSGAVKVTYTADALENVLSRHEPNYAAVQMTLKVGADFTSGFILHKEYSLKTEDTGGKAGVLCNWWMNWINKKNINS